jgi:hypothetical protein
VEFNRDGEEPERVHVTDGTQAMTYALTMISRRHALQIGDTLTVRKGDEGSALPEISRASHLS